MVPISYNTLLSIDELKVHLGDPGWVIFDCRYDLANPTWGESDYQKAHIPGAIFADLNQDLSAPITEKTGRHPLPEPDEWVATLSNWGVTNGKQVVVYDTSGGSLAARMWWMLRWIGHDKCALLDGGFSAWIIAGYPTSSGIETAMPSNFSGQPDSRLTVTAAEVEHIRTDPHFLLLDARNPIRYRGEIEPIDSVPGHIPGAVNLFHSDNLGPDGKFLPADVLHSQYSALLKGLDPSRAVVYCGSGVTACHDLLAMEVAGLSGSKLYPGSWSEWIRDPEHPISKDD